MQLVSIKTAEDHVNVVVAYVAAGVGKDLVQQALGITKATLGGYGDSPQAVA